MKARNFSLAKNQLSRIKENHPVYQSAQGYLKRIDNLEQPNNKTVREEYLLEKKTRDSLMQKYAGNQKMEVDGVASKDGVEVYVPKNDGLPMKF